MSEGDAGSAGWSSSWSAKGGNSSAIQRRVYIGDSDSPGHRKPALLRINFPLKINYLRDAIGRAGAPIRAGRPIPVGVIMIDAGGTPEALGTTGYSMSGSAVARMARRTKAKPQDRNSERDLSAKLRHFGRCAHRDEYTDRQFRIHSEQYRHRR